MSFIYFDNSLLLKNTIIAFFWITLDYILCDVSKRHQIELRNYQLGCVSPIEQQLFHGTRNEEVVRAIFRHNFDWRVSGTANDVVYGRGTYFARDARFSDKYSTSHNRHQYRWMFMARVLVGRSAVGKRDYVRPPPINPAQRHGDLYDSCVNSLDQPKIFVVFDTDQCYPEYVIAYNRMWLSVCSVFWCF